MVKNVGELDAYLRITGGLTLLSIGIMGSSKTLSLLGSMKVAEGITRFCPILYLMGKNTLDWEWKLKKQVEEKLEDPVES
ncbi:MAG TPA: DUF2892 domain-containing protein [Clostridiales bacterium]|nr:DUF2892 domain-containing protein [Clostridiales bacterium]